MQFFYSVNVKWSQLACINVLRMWFDFFWLDFGPGQLTSFMLILSYEDRFFRSQPSSKSTLPLTGLQHIQQCLIGWHIPLSLFDPLHWSIWMVHESGCLNPRPFSYESSALTTRPRLLALNMVWFVFTQLM
jgi:hypothetical protein